MLTLLRFVIPAAASLLLLGCTSQDSAASNSSSDQNPQADNRPSPLKPLSDPDAQPKDGEEVAVLDTSEGRIVFKFFPDRAPKTVENFKKLANEKFYDGTKFHRVIPGFMIQGGDPNTKTDEWDKYGTGGPGYTVPAEFNDLHHGRGIVSMARSQDPDSAGSQFFIMHGDAPSLDHQYTAFGKVVTGMDVVDKIVHAPTEGDRVVKGKEPVIKSARIEKWPVK